MKLVIVSGPSDMLSPPLTVRSIYTLVKFASIENLLATMAVKIVFLYKFTNVQSKTKMKLFADLLLCRTLERLGLNFYLTGKRTTCKH